VSCFFGCVGGDDVGLLFLASFRFFFGTKLLQAVSTVKAASTFTGTTGRPESLEQQHWVVCCCFCSS